MGLAEGGWPGVEARAGHAITSLTFDLCDVRSVPSPGTISLVPRPHPLREGKSGVQ